MTSLVRGKVTLVGISTSSTDCSNPVVVYAKITNVLGWILSHTDAQDYAGERPNNLKLLLSGIELKMRSCH